MVKKKLTDRFVEDDTAENIFNCKSLTTFANCIRQVMDFHTFSASRFYICEYRGVKFFTKLYFYRKSAEEMIKPFPSKYKAHADAEILILDILKREIIVTGISPCIMELVYRKICPNVSKMIPGEVECDKRIVTEYNTTAYDSLIYLFCRYSDTVKRGLAHNKCAFLVLEKCDISINALARRIVGFPLGLEIIKSLLFQIIYTLYAIKRIYPKFRHGDLHSDNIMLKIDPAFRFNAAEPRFLLYRAGRKSFYVPYYGMIPKIIDFGFAQIPEEDVISNIALDKQQVYHRTENDLLFLLHNLYEIGGEYGKDKAQEIDTMLAQVEPNRTYVHFYTGYIARIKDSIPSYQEMLFDSPLWENYLKYNIKKEMVISEYASE